MYYANCEWYVDMGEHNKPLCKKNGYRPAECELCPTRVAALEAENTSLRELVRKANAVIETLCGCVENSPGCAMCPANQDEDKACGAAVVYDRMRELGIEVDG